MMKHLIIFCIVLVFSHQVMAADSKNIFQSMDGYCIGALKAGKDIASFMQEKNITPFPKEDAVKFSPDGGHVYPLSELKGQAVLTTNPKFKTVCSIAIHKTDIEQYKAALYSFFSSAKGYSLVKEKREDAHKITRTEFSGDIGGPVKILITASDSPRPNGIQVLMTIGRLNE